jgi:hypothetical protein
VRSWQALGFVGVWVRGSCMAQLDLVHLHCMGRTLQGRVLHYLGVFCITWVACVVWWRVFCKTLGVFCMTWVWRGLCCGGGRNLVKALPWYTSVRDKIGDPAYAVRVVMLIAWRRALAVLSCDCRGSATLPASLEANRAVSLLTAMFASRCKPSQQR